jgi:MFS family permease
MTDLTAPDDRGLFTWWRAGTPEAKRALFAASMGWMLDSFDVMLYALVLAALMRDLSMDAPTAGLLGSITLLASAAGGLLFGIIADRFGRTRALMASILIYSFFTAACGFAQTVTQLAVFRVFLGLGMGGEWASGAALVSETWPAKHRGKALGFMQSSWAIGYGAAAVVTAIVMPLWGWRGVFFIGVLPALFTLWVRRNVKEPAIWEQQRALPRTGGLGFAQMFAPSIRKITIALTLMNASTMFAWWGFNLWLPGYLRFPAAEGGVGLSTTAMSGFVVAMQVGMWFGYVTFGYASDWIGRKRAYIVYLLTAAALILLYTSIRIPIVLLLLGPFVAFFATGYFSGFGAVTAELYPTKIRATAQGFTYNIGRVASAAAPFAVGSLAQVHGYGAALSICSVAFLVAAVFWIWIPETRGRDLDEPGDLTSRGEDRTPQAADLAGSPSFIDPGIRSRT